MTRNRTRTSRKASIICESAQAPAPAAEENRADIYQRITDRIAAAIEAGAGKWQMPWHPGADGAAPRLPVNAATGKPYRGRDRICRKTRVALVGFQGGGGHVRRPGLR